MQLLEEYQELVERDSAEISFIWKAVQTFFYFLCAVSGYACSILFYLLWEIFDGRCPLWSEVNFVSIRTLESDDISIRYIDVKSMIRSSPKVWRQYIILENEYQIRCKIYFATCFLSCMFGIIWLTLFAVCGKGGYYIGIFDAPWRIVLPALIFNFVLMIITVCTTYDMKKGYVQFSRDIKQLFLEISDLSKPAIGLSECEIIQAYVEAYNSRDYNTCNIFLWLQISSWIMTWSWIGSVVVLVIRIIRISDFRILKVMIYDVPSNDGQTEQLEVNKGDQKEKKD